MKTKKDRKALLQSLKECDTPVDAKVEALVAELIGRVADKWTMLDKGKSTQDRPHATVVMPAKTVRKRR